MKIISVLAAAWPALAAGAVSAAPAPQSAPAPDDFGCLVRTMSMAGAADASASKATDAKQREDAHTVATEAYEAATYYIGRLTMTKGGNFTKARFDAEVARLEQLGQDVVADQISQCTLRSKQETAAFVNSMAKE